MGSYSASMHAQEIMDITGVREFDRMIKVTTSTVY
jgi:hypothetical protein